MIVKEHLVARKNVSDSFRFENTYSMKLHGTEENGHNWNNGHIAYHKLYTVVSEAVTGFTHIYCYDDTKFKFLSQLLGCPILTLDYSI